MAEGVIDFLVIAVEEGDSFVLSNRGGFPPDSGPVGFREGRLR